MSPESRLFSRLRLPAIVLLLLAASVVADMRLVANLPASAEQRIHLPQPEWIDGVSLGYRNLWSEVLWIRTLSWFGANVRHADYNYLGELLTAIVRLNPRARHAYYMAGAVLPWNTGNTRLSRPLLERAMRAFPDDWRWPYYRGFNAYWFDHDKSEAGRLLAHAAALPGAPPLAARLALRMQASAGELGTALLFVQQLLRQKQDAHIRAQLEGLLKDIETEDVLRGVDSRLASLPHRFHDARDLQQLRAAGFHLPAVLPDGGHIVMRADGKLVSSASGRRFGIFVPPKRRKASE